MAPILKPCLAKLELAILETLWVHDQLDAKQLHRLLSRSRKASFSTIQSALDRLFHRSALRREKWGRAYVYRPSLSRRALLAELISEVIETLAADRDETMLAVFVELAERIDEDHLACLERLIAQRRRDRAYTATTCVESSLEMYVNDSVNPPGPGS